MGQEHEELCSPALDLLLQEGPSGMSGRDLEDFIQPVIRPGRIGPQGRVLKLSPSSSDFYGPQKVVSYLRRKDAVATVDRVLHVS